MQRRPRARSLWPSGEDTPLFSGAPQTAQQAAIAPAAPPPTHEAAELPGMPAPPPRATITVNGFTLPAPRDGKTLRVGGLTPCVVYHRPTWRPPDGVNVIAGPVADKVFGPGWRVTVMWLDRHQRAYHADRTAEVKLIRPALAHEIHADYWTREERP
jgi:hypothetical protein